MASTRTEIVNAQLESENQNQFSISVRTSNPPGPPASLSANDINTSPDILLLGGTYTITALNPSASRDGPAIKIGDIHTLGANGRMSLEIPTSSGQDKVSSKEGEAIADFWNQKVQACQNTFNQHAQEMEFTLIGTLILDVVDRKLGLMQITFPNVGIGRGKSPRGTYVAGHSTWWFGGQTFEHMADDEKNINTVRALGSDTTGRARYFYFSSVVGKTSAGEVVDELALIKIYGY